MYQITRVINNNVVMAQNDRGEERILRGLGIGFGRRPGQPVEEDKIEKVYRLDEEDSKDDVVLQQLLKEIPKEQVELSVKIVDYAKDVIGNSVDDVILVTLTDHINFLLKRVRMNRLYSNPMLSDIKLFYPTEYAIAVHAVSMLEEAFGITLNEDEAGFIALHVVNAELDKDMCDTVQITGIIQELVKIVEKYYGREIDTDSICYNRFITHLKYFGQRIVTKQEARHDVFEDLYQTVCSRCPKEYQCAISIGNYVSEHFGYTVSDDEKMYLTIHLKQLM